jgi:hypothetical protein
VFGFGDMAHEKDGYFEIAGDMELVRSESVMAAYLSASKKLRLWGPTDFAPIINRVAKEAKE